MERLSPEQAAWLERCEGDPAGNLRLQRPDLPRRLALKARILATTSASAGPELRPAAKDGLKAIAHAAYLEPPARQLSPERRAAILRIPQSRARTIRLQSWSSVAAACLIAFLFWQPNAPDPQTASAPRTAPPMVAALPAVALQQETRSITLETSEVTVAVSNEPHIPSDLVALNPLVARPLASQPARADVRLPEAGWAAAETSKIENIAPNYRAATPRFQQALHRGGQRLLVRTRGKLGWEVPEGTQVVKFRVHVGRLHWTAAR